MGYWIKVDESVIVEKILIKQAEGLKENNGYSWLIDEDGNKWTYWDDSFIDSDLFFSSPVYLDSEKNMFVRSPVSPSWILDENSGEWFPPKPYPKDGKMYFWDEEKIEWIEVVEGVVE